jgi:hypothetical protein
MSTAFCVFGKFLSVDPFGAFFKNALKSCAKMITLGQSAENLIEDKRYDQENHMFRSLGCRLLLLLLVQTRQYGAAGEGIGA